MLELTAWGSRPNSRLSSIAAALFALPRSFELSPRDHFVVPSWHTARLSSAQGCVLFSFSDRPVHDALALHKEERLS